jgi:hypothetical protein
MPDDGLLRRPEKPIAQRRKHESAWRCYGGPAQPSPTIGQCINGGLGWLEVECNRCKTRASVPLDCFQPATRHTVVEA